MSMDYSTRNEITEAAVVQSLTENEIIRTYINKLNTPLSDHPITIQEVLDGVAAWNYNDGKVSTPVPEDMGIIRSYVATHPEFGNAEILSSHAFKDGGHCMVISNGDDKYVAFDGTDGDAEWKDNGEGLYKAYSDHQMQAKEYFNGLVNDSVISSDDNVIVTGHSKGGNKAMFVTMEDQAGIVDKCIALDGQGFSPEAINRWNKMYQGTNGYADRTGKITLVAGSNDYVHALGISIAGTKYTVGYNPWVTTGDNPNSIKDGLASWHSHEHLFSPVWDEKLGMYNFVLNPEAQPSPIEGVLNNFMDSFMKLSPAERKLGADPVMNFFRKGTDNTLWDYVGLIGILMKIGLEKAGFDALLLMVGYFNPALEKTILPIIRNMIKSKTASSAVVSVGSSASSGAVVIGSSIGGNASSSVSGSGSPTTIVLNKEFLMDLSTNLDSVFEEAQVASDYAYKAETVVYDEIGSKAIQVVPQLQAQVIKEIIYRIIESFTSVDSQNRKEAEDIIGPEIYRCISNGGTAVCNSDGSYSVQYPIDGYQCLKQHLSDNCTNTSLAMMIQRYYMLHNGSCDLVYDDINKNSFYWAVEDYGKKMSRDLPNGGHYTTNGGSSADLRDLGGGSPQAGLVAQLNAHPEGVVIYGRYGNNTGSHAIVISGYQVKADGSYSFTALDPATGKETPLTDSTLYNNRKQYNSVDDLLNNLYFYQYLESVT